MFRWLIWLSLVAPLAYAAPAADKVVVDKAAHRLSLFQAGKLLASFPIALGFAPVGHKTQQGDGRTPEGQYRLTAKNAASRYYKSIRISYPNQADRAAAQRRGVNPGGDVMIHGQPNGYAWAAAATQQRDWTLGCIALTNADMDQVWSLVAAGTAIEIKP
jgi:murein L,D-transpeptidase YafK